MRLFLVFLMFCFAAECWITTSLLLPTRPLCQLRSSLRGRLHLQAYKPITYIPVNVPFSNGENRELLINSSEKELAEIARGWNKKESKSRDSTINKWIKAGSAFWANPSGLQELEDQESKRERDYNAGIIMSENEWQAVTTYVNCGSDSEPAYVETRKYRKLVREGRIPSSLPLSQDRLTGLVNQGLATTNSTHLFLRERVLHRADDIALRIASDFPIASDEWTRWSNKTAEYSATTLTQAISTYYATQSIADIGGPDSDYVPKAGYIGTLAPGEKFEEAAPMSELPNKVLHPWPAMQEHAFHVRWPPSHPMIPPPLLWIALNNMYTESYAASELARSRGPDDTNTFISGGSGGSGSRGGAGDALVEGRVAEKIVGGTMMEPRDALRIARGAVFGKSYEPADQVPHGGSVFDYGYNIPFYNPDHGPTVSAEEAEPDIPPELRAITQTWTDPLRDVDNVPTIAEDTEAAELADVEAEEAQRRAIAERLLSAQPTPPWEIVEAQQRAALEAEVDRRLQGHREQRAREQQEERDNERRERDLLLAEALSRDPAYQPRTQTIAEASQPAMVAKIDVNMQHVKFEPEAAEVGEDEFQLREKFRKEVENTKLVNEIKQGTSSPRSRRALIKYNIETSEALIERITAAERDASVANTRVGRRRARRRESADSSIAEDLVGGVPLEGDAVDLLGMVDDGDVGLLGAGAGGGVEGGAGLLEDGGLGMGGADDGAGY